MYNKNVVFEVAGNYKKFIIVRTIRKGRNNQLIKRLRILVISIKMKIHSISNQINNHTFIIC